MASYNALLKSGELENRVAAAREMLRDCALCPRACHVDRLAGGRGVCRAGAAVSVSSWNDHHGEEPPISGTCGSGTIFLTNCNLRCPFCQNYPISQLSNGEEVTAARFADMMLALQRRGCHNINFVTPTHYMPQILEAVMLAARGGLNIPLVYNCGGYESLEALRLLDGVIDIYMPDCKYGSDEVGERISGAPGYFTHAKAALAEMYRQVGALEMDEEEIAVRGLIVRHLVLPNGLSGSKEVFEFIVNELGPDVFMSIMEQYFPAHLGQGMPELSRRITREEYGAAVQAAEDAGLFRGWVQGGC